MGGYLQPIRPNTNRQGLSLGSGLLGATALGTVGFACCRGKNVYQGHGQADVFLSAYMFW